jgi:hypothetical protein
MIGSAGILMEVETFFEEDLGIDLIRRASSMGLHEFAPLLERLETNQAIWTTPERPRGHLRPFLFTPGVGYSDDPLWNQAHLLFPPMGLEMHLLYFHEVAVSDPLLLGLSGALGSLAAVDALRWLTYAAPLIRAGLVHLEDSRLRRSQFAPVRRADYGPDVDPSRPLAIVRGHPFASAEEHDEIAVLLGSLGVSAEDAELQSLFGQTTTAANVRRALLGTLAQPAGMADLWFPGAEEAAFSRGVLDRLAQVTQQLPALPPSARLNAMTQLNRLQLPASVKLSVSDLVIIRTNEGVFHAWREALASALRELPEDRVPNEPDLVTAREALAEAAAHLREAKSKVSSILVDEMRTLGFGFVGTGVSAAVFGARGAAAGASATGATALLRTASRVTGVLRSRALAHATAQHFAVFDVGEWGPVQREGWHNVYVSGVPL